MELNKQKGTLKKELLNQLIPHTAYSNGRVETLYALLFQNLSTENLRKCEITNLFLKWDIYGQVFITRAITDN